MLFWNIATLAHCVVYGCFHATTVVQQLQQDRLANKLKILLTGLIEMALSYCIRVYTKANLIAGPIQVLLYFLSGNQWLRPSHQGAWSILVGGTKIPYVTGHVKK